MNAKKLLRNKLLHKRFHAFLESAGIANKPIKFRITKKENTLFWKYQHREDTGVYYNPRQINATAEMVNLFKIKLGYYDGRDERLHSILTGNYKLVRAFALAHEIGHAVFHFRNLQWYPLISDKKAQEEFFADTYALYLCKKHGFIK
jgi:Zn-dependent peptidase ImmA (M78 family)